MGLRDRICDTLILIIALLVLGIALTCMGSLLNQSYQEWKETECSVIETSGSYNGPWNDGWSLEWQVIDVETKKNHTITQKYSDRNTYLAALDTFKTGNSYTCYHTTDIDWTWDIGVNAGVFLIIIGVAALCFSLVGFVVSFLPVRKEQFVQLSE